MRARQGPVGGRGPGNHNGDAEAGTSGGEAPPEGLAGGSGPRGRRGQARPGGLEGHPGRGPAPAHLMAGTADFWFLGSRGWGAGRGNFIVLWVRGEKGEEVRSSARPPRRPCQSRASFRLVFTAVKLLFAHPGFVRGVGQRESLTGLNHKGDFRLSGRGRASGRRLQEASGHSSQDGCQPVAATVGSRASGAASPAGQARHTLG